MTDNGEKLTKNERRAAAREKARLQHEARIRREKRNRGLTIGGIVIAALAVVVVVVMVIVNGIRPAAPGPENMAADGIVVGQGLEAERTDPIPVDGEMVPTEQTDDILQIVIYQDYMCGHCGTFEQTNGETIRALVEQGLATVEYHPVSFLDNSSLGSKYSTRAANAAACVAEHSPDSFFEWNTLMFANQPDQMTTGLEDEQMIELAGQAGVDTEGEFTDCVRSVHFEDWVRDVVDRLYAEPVPYTYEGGEEVQALQTPTVLVNGRHYQGPNEDAAVFQGFIQSVQGELEAAGGSDEEGTDEEASQEPSESPSESETEETP